MNKFEEQVFKMYEKINIGKTDICQKCRAQKSDLSIPISLWQVGDKYYDSEYRILFVGKVARDTPNGKVHDNFVDVTKRADELFKEGKWAYWSYTKAIINNIYDANAWEKIAFTNMVKCNNSNTVDTTNNFMRSCCVHVLKEEIKILKPKTIVFYTKGYDNQIEQLFDTIINSETEYVSIGAKKMSSWTFDGTIDGNTSRVIRVNHPERMKKDEYVNHIVNFIRK